MMVEVPRYDPVPNVQPTEQGAPSVHIATPPEAFGAGIAQQTQKLGSDFSQVGNELFTRAVAMQQLTNETDAKNADAEYTKQSTALYAKFGEREGKDAFTAYPQYQKDLEDLRQGIRGSLSNPMAQRMYDSASLSTLGRADFQGATWSRTQHKAYVDGGAKSAIETAQVTAGNSWNDPVAFDKAIQTIKDQATFLGHVHGWSDIETSAHSQDAVAQAQYKRFETMAIQKPFEARSLFNQDPTVVGKYRPQTEAMLERQEANVGSREIAHSLIQGSYMDKLVSQESGGDLLAKNKLSSAEGLGQITGPTWLTIRVNHPDLDLPVKLSDATGDQQMTALKALTEDNQKALAARGFPTTDQNTYLAHFLGASGAASFLTGMQDDPGQPGTALVSPEAAKANPAIFYNPDGSPRSAGSVFTRLTARFAGAGPLDANSPSTWLPAQVAVGREVAKELSPNNPALEDSVVSRLQSAWHLQHTETVQAQLSGYNQLAFQVIGGGDWAKRITSMDTIYHNPQLNQVFLGLNDAQKTSLVKQVGQMARTDIPLTPQGRLTYYRTLGAMENPETSVAARSLDIGSLGLPSRETGILLQRQQKLITTLQQTDGLSQALHDPQVSATIRGLGLDPKSDDYNQLLGAFSIQLREWREIHGAPVKPEDARTIAKSLVATSGGFMGFGATTGYQQTPQSFVDEITPLYQRRYGAPPTRAQIDGMYQRALSNPNWREGLR